MASGTSTDMDMLKDQFSELSSRLNHLERTVSGSTVLIKGFALLPKEEIHNGFARFCTTVLQIAPEVISSDTVLASVYLGTKENPLFKVMLPVAKRVVLLLHSKNHLKQYNLSHKTRYSMFVCMTPYEQTLKTRAKYVADELKKQDPTLHLDVGHNGSLRINRTGQWVRYSELAKSKGIIVPSDSELKKEMKKIGSGKSNGKRKLEMSNDTSLDAGDVKRIGLTEGGDNEYPTISESNSR